MVSRGVLGLVWSVLYVYGQPKPNISVCEILNWNWPKWLETVGFDGISVSVAFSRVLVLQREGYWDFQNPNFNHIKKNTKKKNQLSNRAIEQSWWTKLIQSDRERKEKRERKKKNRTKIAEQAGACCLIVSNPSQRGISRMPDPSLIKEIKRVVSIPIMVRARVGHFVEAQIL